MIETDTSNINENQTLITECEPEHFAFPVNRTAILFVLNINNNYNKKGIRNISSKMIMINEEKDIILDDLSSRLGFMKMEKLNIFSIDDMLNDNTIISIKSNNGSQVIYIEMNVKNTIKFLASEYNDFVNYNKHSLFILRNGNYLDIKNIFSTINNSQVNLGRGGSQKSHIVSPLDSRFSFYLIAMFDFDYKLISSLNTFYEISKDKYLTYKNMSLNKKVNKKIIRYLVSC